MKKKKTIKINFKYFCEGFDCENNFFTNLLRKKYKVVISDKPDYMFYSVYAEIKEKKGLSKKGDFIRKISPDLYILVRKIYSKLNSKNNKRVIPKGNFVKILWSSENIKPNMDECDWAFSSYPEEQINNPHYMRLPIYLMNNYLFNKEMTLPLERDIDFEKRKKEKTKFCNFIYSQEIHVRNNFFKKLSKYKKIDAPGRCMNNMPPISHNTARESRLSKNWAKEKLEFIKPYKFTIAFENKVKDGWITEKLVHPLIVNSIPIYIGSKSVNKDFNTKCFINYNDFNSMEDFIAHIIKVDNDDELYRQYLEQPIFNNKEQYNFSCEQRIIERLNKIIESKND